MKNKKLLKLIRKKAVRRGEVTLASGEKSDYYIDMSKLLFDAEALRLIGKAVRRATKKLDFDCIGGPETGAIPITAATVLRCKNVTGFSVKRKAKGHGTGENIEGRLGTRAVIVEDVVTTGSSVQDAVDAVKNAGCEVVGVVSLVDRGGRYDCREYRPIFTLDDLGLNKA